MFLDASAGTQVGGGTQDAKGRKEAAVSIPCPLMTRGRRARSAAAFLPYPLYLGGLSHAGHFGVGPEGESAAVSILDLGCPTCCPGICGAPSPLPAYGMRRWSTEGPGVSGTGISRKFSFSLIIRVSWAFEIGNLRDWPHWTHLLPPPSPEKNYSLKRSHICLWGKTRNKRSHEPSVA